MAATFKLWQNNQPPSLEDADLNGFKNENNNLIVGSGQALDTADLQQTHRAVSAYSHGGSFYTDTGGLNAYVLSPDGSRVTPDAYFNGLKVRFRAGGTNTGAATASVGALGAKNITLRGTALIGGEIEGGREVSLTFDAANDWLALDVVSAAMLAEDSNTFVRGVDVASAAALPILSDGAYFDVTGNADITSIAARRVGAAIKLHFNEVLTLTHHVTNLVLPGGADITTVAGAEAEFVEYALGDWRLVSYLQTTPTDILVTEVIDIGDWNMDTTTDVFIPHGLVAGDIRSVDVVVRDGVGNADPLTRGRDVLDCNQQGYASLIGGFNVRLTRLQGGVFDSVPYNNTSYNRGWVTFRYAP